MSIDAALQLISRGTAEIINLDGLKAKLREAESSRRKLRIKAGFDPTAPDLHLGHVVLLRKLRHFQDLGHQVFFLIGDFTAQIGDPTGKDQLRPKMDVEKIADNAKTYRTQVFKILDEQKTEVVFNSEWLGRLTAGQMLNLTQYSSVAQMLARADFKERFESKKEISILEFIYPLLQGYDSVHLKADVELGGSDQKFNLLMGRQLQEAFGQAAQSVVMTPLLEGTDGVNKMSKSLGNYIGINEPPREIFGKVMSVADDLMYRYYELLTDFNLSEVCGQHPMEAKKNLAREIVKQFHGEPAADQEKDFFERTFSQKQIPQDVPEYSLKSGASVTLMNVLLNSGVASSKNDVRRLLQQGAVAFEGSKISDENWGVRAGVLRIGKKRFLKIVD